MIFPTLRSVTPSLQLVSQRLMTLANQIALFVHVRLLLFFFCCQNVVSKDAFWKRKVDPRLQPCGEAIAMCMRMHTA